MKLCAEGFSLLAASIVLAAPAESRPQEETYNTLFTLIYRQAPYHCKKIMYTIKTGWLGVPVFFSLSLLQHCKFEWIFHENVTKKSAESLFDDKQKQFPAAQHWTGIARVHKMNRTMADQTRISDSMAHVIKHDPLLIKLQDEAPQKFTRVSSDSWNQKVRWASKKWRKNSFISHLDLFYGKQYMAFFPGHKLVWPDAESTMQALSLPGTCGEK